MSDVQAPRPRFDFTFRLEHLITLVGVAVTIIGGWYVMDRRLSEAEAKISAQAARHELQVERLTQAVIAIVRIDTRLTEIDRRIGNLERAN